MFGRKQARHVTTAQLICLVRPKSNDLIAVCARSAVSFTKKTQIGETSKQSCWSVITSLLKGHYSLLWRIRFFLLSGQIDRNRFHKHFSYPPTQLFVFRLMVRLCVCVYCGNIFNSCRCQWWVLKKRSLFQIACSFPARFQMQITINGWTDACWELDSDACTTSFSRPLSFASASVTSIRVSQKRVFAKDQDQDHVCSQSSFWCY